MAETTETKNIVVLQNANAVQQQQQTADSLSLVDILIKCLIHWPWFVLCVGVALVVAFFYAKGQEPVFSRSTSIMIKEDAKTSAGGQIDAGVDMGLFKTTSSAANELVAIQSPYVIEEVVNRLKLYMNYATDGRFHKVTLYGRSLPIEVEMLDLSKESGASLKIELSKSGAFSISEFEARDFESDAVVKGKLGDTVKTPIGRVRVLKSSSWKMVDDKMTIYVSHISREAAIRNCLNKMNAALNDKQSTIINIGYQDVVIKRAEDYLNTLVTVYNENWIKDRNQIAVATSDFIVNRIRVIERELGDVDTRISSYKSSNLIPDLNASTQLSMQNASQAQKEVAGLNTQLAMLQFLLDHVNSMKGKFQLLPANSGIGVASIESQIAVFNNTMLRRNGLVANSSEQNPLVQDIDNELAAMQSSIVASIRNQITSITAQLQSTQSQQSAAQNTLARNPERGKHLLSVERQQSVKEALYIFLLQKREENELSQAFTAYNTRIITPPFGSSFPVSPQTAKIMLVALLLGLLLPFGVIYLFETMNTTVRGRKDLDNIKTPFVGEIPMYGLKRMSFMQRLRFRYDRFVLMWSGKKRDRESEKHLKIVVKPGKRNVINEAFRVIRGNLEFMKTDKSSIFLVTSANAGSGKTFVTANLGASFAIKNRKTLIIDLDFRKRSLSKMIGKPEQGIADYLAGHVDNYESLIVKNQMTEGLDILPVGSLPPNPSELLYDPRLEAMVKELREKYDVIFFDCPPAELVADVSIISPLADKTLFLIRSGVFQRNMLPDVDRIYESKKYGNLSIILNGTDNSHSRYGYRYGYQYGYGYGYGYGSDKS